MKKRVLALLLALTALLLSACGGKFQTQDLMTGIQAQPVSAKVQDPEADALAATEFSVRLFQACLTEGENTLVSPLSVLYALAMTANGAQGETLAQMEAVLGLPLEELNACLCAYRQTLSAREDAQLNIANSIWLKDDDSLQVNEDFLNANAAWYDAGVYQAPFDKSTVQDINAWVEDHTGGLIQNILDDIPESAVLYLINALVFDAQWQNVYYDYQVKEGTFTKEDGTRQETEFMYSDEYAYLEDDSAAGVMKNYEGGAYDFVALLPKDGVSLADYAASLTGENLRKLLETVQNVKVDTAIPKFRSEYTGELSELLQSMGITDAFDPDLADFSALGETTNGPLYISQVLHKTFLAVDERGTQAGAATIVETSAGAAAPEEGKTVYLDRPFLYMIVDRETGLPVFLGTAVDLDQ